MTNRSIVTVRLASLMLATGVPASAQQATCLAGKTKCMSKKGTGLLRCEQLAETPGRPANPNANDCVTNVIARFDGGVEPAKGCFEKLENKNGEARTRTAMTPSRSLEVRCAMAMRLALPLLGTVELAFNWRRINHGS